MKPIFGEFGVIQWFFTSLFFAELWMWAIIRLASGFNKKIQMIIYVYFCTFLMILRNVLSAVSNTNILGIVSSLFGTVMCITGFATKSICLKANEKFKIHHVLAGVVSFCLLIIVWLVNGSTNMRMAQYNNIILYYIGALAGSIFIFCVSVFCVELFSRFKLYKVCLYLGQNTALILCFNRLVQWSVICWLNGLFGYVLGDTSVGLVKMIILEIFDIIIAMACFVPIIYLVNKYLPFSMGRNTRWLRRLSEMLVKYDRQTMED